jgi:hypothetical protein
MARPPLGSAIERIHPGVAIALALVLTWANGCGSSGGGGSDDLVDCRNSQAVAANQIALQCGGVATDEVTVLTVIGGPTGSADIFEVLFDLTFDDTLLEFVEGSLLEGDLFSGPTIATATLSQTDSSRVLVTVALQGPVSGVGAPAGETMIFSLVFRALGTPGASALLIENAQVLDSAGFDVAPTVVFKDGLTLAVS